MASDTLTCFGDSQRVANINSPCEKIRRLGPVILGSTGWAIYDDILENSPHISAASLSANSSLPSRLTAMCPSFPSIVL